MSFRFEQLTGQAAADADKAGHARRALTSHAVAEGSWNYQALTTDRDLR